MKPSTRTRASFPGNRRIRVGNLDPAAFAPFGDVIQNPATHDNTPKLEYAVANQGTAHKWLDVTGMTNWYEGRARSGRGAKCVINMFVCSPRQLGQREGREVFGVKVLERHPFTAQTFVPVGLGREETRTCYLVIVAPTLPGPEGSDFASVPQRRRSWKEMLFGAKPLSLLDATTPATLAVSRTTERGPKGTGPPDLDNIQAFIARGDQAVTYGPGTWHAPMVVLGEKPIDFVVVQYANRVTDEDCQEVEIAEGHIDVDLTDGGVFGRVVMAKL